MKVLAVAMLVVAAVLFGFVLRERGKLHARKEMNPNLSEGMPEWTHLLALVIMLLIAGAAFIAR